MPRRVAQTPYEYSATLAQHLPEAQQDIAELTDALTNVAENAEIRALVLTGEGSTFSAGADLNWMRAMAGASETDNREDSQRLARLMHGDVGFRSVSGEGSEFWVDMPVDESHEPASDVLRARQEDIE